MWSGNKPHLPKPSHGLYVKCFVFALGFLRFRLQFPIDFRLLFRYCVTCETYAKYKNQEEMQMTNTKKRITAALTAAILATTLTIPATAAETPTIRVSSYKGSTLEVGERSGLIIGPSGTE